MTLGTNGKVHAVNVAEIAAVSITERGVVELRLVDADKREWLVRLPLDVLDASLRRLSGERSLALNVETADDHARLTYPTLAWELSRDPSRPDLTFACRTDDGCGVEVGFGIDPVTALPKLAVTVAAG